MTTTAPILDHLRDWLCGTTAASDAELLARFTSHRDEDAFAALLERHGPLVWGVCRRVLGDRHAAEDVFQATFLVLVRNPGGVRRPESLAAWLHGVAHRLAVRASRRERYRHVAEANGSSRSERDPLDKVSGRELLAILDAEIERLPEKDRLPLILCCLEGFSLDEAASRLGITPGAVKGRLERSRLRLRRNLERRGFTITAALGTGLLVTAPTLARPLIESTIAVCFGSATVPDAVAALVIATPRPRLWLALLIGIMGIGIGWIAVAKSSVPDAPQPPADAPNKPAPEQLPPGVVARLGVPRLPLRAPMAFAPDGRTFVGVSGDSVIRFDAATGKAIEQTAFPERFNSSKLSMDGRTLVTSANAAPKVWDAASGRMLLQVTTPGRTFQSALSPDGKALAVVVSDGRDTHRLSVWNVATGVERVLEPTKALWHYLLFSPDGKRLLVWYSAPTLTCWDVVSGQIEWTAKGRCDRLLFAPDGQSVFQFQQSRGWSALSATTGQAVEGFKLPSDAAYSEPAVAPDNRTFLLPTKRGVTFWDMKEGRELRVLPGTERETMSGWSFLGPFAPDGKSFLTNFGAVQRYDLATGNPLLPDTTGLGHTATPSSFAFSPDGKWLASGSWEDYTVRIWETASGRLAHSLRGHTSAMRKMQFTPDSTRLVTGAHDSTVRIWDTASGRELHVLRLHDGRNRDEFQQVATLRIAPDGRRVTITAIEGFRGADDDANYVLSVWDLIDGRRLDQRRKPFGKIAELMNLPLTAEGALLLENGRLLGSGGALLKPTPLIDANEVLYDSCLTTDERLAAARLWLRNDPAGASAVLLWEAATGRPVVRLPIAGIQRMAFDPTGTRVVTVSPSGIQTWELRTGRAVRTHPVRIPANTYFTFTVAVAPDGQTAATGCLDSTILIWDVAPPKSVATPLTAADCAAAWADLAHPDAANGFAATCRLADDPKQSLPFLKDRLRPVSPPPADEVKPLLNDLNRPQFKTREAAEKALRLHGDRIESQLRDALATNPTAEAKKRIEAILAGFAPSVVPEGELLRGIRAVWALERIGTPESRRVLEELAKGVESARLTREAKASLAR